MRNRLLGAGALLALLAAGYFAWKGFQSASSTTDVSEEARRLQTTQMKAPPVAGREGDVFPGEKSPQRTHP